MHSIQALGFAFLLRWRLRLRGIWARLASTLWLQDDPIDDEAWLKFELQQLKDSVETITLLLPCMGIASGFAAAGAATHGARHGNVQGVCFIFMMVVLMAIELLSRKAKGYEKGNLHVQWWLLVACIASFVFLALINSLMSAFLSENIISHRAFVLKFTCCGTLISTCIYMPLLVHILAVSCQCGMIWCLFHWITDFLTPASCVVGISLICMNFCFFVVLRKNRWSSFTMCEKEKHATALSKSLLETLRAVLFKMFDASCECDEAGHVHCSSKALEQLLGRSSLDLEDVDLMQLAVNREEAQRVNTFLKQVMQQSHGFSPHVVSPVALLETAFRCSGPLLDSTNNNVNVKLTCVALPMKCTVGPVPLVAEAQRLFVGLQVIESPLICGDSSGRSDLEARSGDSIDCVEAVEAVEAVNLSASQRPACLGDEPSHGAYGVVNKGSFEQRGQSDLEARSDNSIDRVANEAVDLSASQQAAVTRWELWCMEQRDQEGRDGSEASAPLSMTNSDHMSARSRRRSDWEQFRPGQRVGTETEISFALSSSTRRSFAVAREAAVQTDVSSHLESKETQTDKDDGDSFRQILEIDEVISVEEHYAGPEASAVTHATRIPTYEQTQQRRHPRPPRLPTSHHVDLTTRKRFTRKFKETPKETIDQLILSLLLRLNPRGKGCCFRHIGLVNVHRHICQLVMDECQTEFKPFCAWQCPACFSLQHETDEWPCDICGFRQDACSDGSPTEELSASTGYDGSVSGHSSDSSTPLMS